MLNFRKPKVSQRLFFPQKDILNQKHQDYRVAGIIFLYLTLSTIGLINLYSASHGTHFFFTQLRNAVGIFFIFILVGWIIPIKRFQSNAYWIYSMVCVMLGSVFVIGRIAGGSQRWLSIGPIGFQPSEFAKLAIALLVARFFQSSGLNKSYTLRELMPLTLTTGLMFILIFSQPDFGTAGVCILIALSQVLFIRVDIRSIGLVLISLPAIATALWSLFLKDYQRLRILNLFNPGMDPQNSGYNSIQSLIAVGSGGLFGKGHLQGTQAHLKFLPERHTDFAFSVFAEEHGFWGSALVLFLFAVLAYIALDIAKDAKDTFSGLLAIGISAFIFFEFAINVAMIIGLFPIVGLPLHFFSFGSSSLLTVCTSLGLLVAINRANNNKPSPRRAKS